MKKRKMRTVIRCRLEIKCGRKRRRNIWIKNVEDNFFILFRHHKSIIRTHHIFIISLQQVYGSLSHHLIFLQLIIILRGKPHFYY
jgi:hypothetical protein